MLDHPEKDKVLVYMREKGDAALVVMLNFTAEQISIRLEGPGGGLYRDIMSKNEADWKEINQVDLKGWGFKVFIKGPK